MRSKLTRFVRTVYHKRAIVLLIAVFIALSWYIGYLTFGPRSFLVLSQNHSIEKALRDNIELIRIQNANLQKKLFEIKGLEP